MQDVKYSEPASGARVSLVVPGDCAGLRLDQALVELLASSDPGQRVSIAQAHEPALREGLRGYDPFARIPNARVVVLG